jgi:SAM-dependent methyltransferase
MSAPLGRHQAEIRRNRQSWERKPLLREIYRGFYARILAQIDRAVPGRVVEIGSGIGNLREHFPEALATDLFPNPWLDLACDGYELPFRAGSLSHLILFDVFHHLEAPAAFLREARRALSESGRLVIFDPYISLASWPAYGLFHHEPIAWNQPVNLKETHPRPRHYYAAQGNATRLFFGRQPWRPEAWSVLNAERFAAFAYLLSGGFSKPALYPKGLAGFWRGVDRVFSLAPALFGARCLVTLRPEPIRGR